MGKHRYRGLRLRFFCRLRWWGSLLPSLRVESGLGRRKIKIVPAAGSSLPTIMIASRFNEVDAPSTAFGMAMIKFSKHIYLDDNTAM